MRNATKLGLGFGALALAAVASAQAGNIPVSPVQCYSAMVPAGFRLQYNGPNAATTTLLVDDVSFTAWINPLSAPQRAAYFPRGVLAPHFTPPNGGTNGNANNIVPFPIYRYSEARGTDYAMTVIEGGAMMPDQEFDRMSHSTHAELYATSNIAQLQTGSYFGNPGDLENVLAPYPYFNPGTPGGQWTYVPPPAPVSENLWDWELSGVTMSTWATPTSDSRHYQTPQIVQPGHWVDVRSFGNGSPSYVSGMCFIKGRLAEGQAAPIETIVTVQPIPGFVPN